MKTIPFNRSTTVVSIILLVLISPVSSTLAQFQGAHVIGPTSLSQLDTVTIYGDWADGEVLNLWCGSDWSTCRNASTGNRIWQGLTVGTVGATYDSKGYTVQRIFLFFDTSSIPTDAQVIGATLHAYAGQYQQGNKTIHAVRSTANIPLTTADFSKVEYVSGGSVTPASPNSWVSINLDPNALSWVIKGGMTKLALIHQLDLNNTVPVVPNDVLVGLAEHSQYRPYLVVNYSSTPCVLPGFGDADGNPIQQHTDAMMVPYGGHEFTLINGTTAFLPFRWTPPTDYIYEWGCKLISGVMIINYFAARQGVAHRTDPVTLNNWMAHNITNSNTGYFSGLPLDDNNAENWENPTHVHWATVPNVTLVEYAKAHGIDMALDYTGTRDDNALNTAMCDLNPAILGVRSNGHFVAASGKTVVRDIATWRLHDPLASAPTNLLDAYAQTYGSLIVYAGSKRKSAISLALYSPAEITVTDPDGRRTGIDPRTGTDYQEIPSSSYGQELLEADDGTGGILEHKVLSILTPASGEYLIEVVGTGSGVISLDIVTVDSFAVASNVTISDTILPDEVIEYQLDYSSAPFSLFLPFIGK